MFHSRQSGSHWRVWVTGWGGDQFEVFHPDDYATLKAGLIRLSQQIIEHDDTDD